MIGFLSATDAELRSGVPVVGSFAVDNTVPVFIKVVAVDNAGNRSRPSLPAQVSVLLVDDAHISNLNVSKVEAGEITAQWVQGGLITTNASGVGAKIGMDGLGFFGIDAEGSRFFGVDEGGVYSRGTFTTGKTGQKRIIIDPITQAMFFYPDETVQRYIFQSYTADEFNDEADTPGIRIYGVNEANQREGAYQALWEDGFSTRLVNAATPSGSAGTTGGYLYGYRSGMVVGYENAADANSGYYAFFQPDAWQIRSRNSNGRGGYLFGGVDFLQLQVRDAGTTDRSHINLNPDTIHIQPGGAYPNRGWLDIRHPSQGAPSSPQIRFLTGEGFGTLIKAWGSNMEIRRWDDVTGASIVADAFVPFSDREFKTDIRAAEGGALDKVRAMKPSKYKRKGPATPTEALTVDRVLVEDEIIDGKKHKAGTRVREERFPARPGDDGPDELGLIAQEVPEELQVQTSAGLGLDLYGLVTMLVQAVQEQAEVNDDQAEEITKLREQVGTLESQMAEVLKALKIDPNPGKPKKDK